MKESNYFSDSKSFSDPKEAERYVESVLAMYPQNLFKTKIDLWNLPKNGPEVREYLVSWEIYPNG
jgi:hypothetical protein